MISVQWNPLETAHRAGSHYRPQKRTDFPMARRGSLPQAKITCGV